MHYLASLCFVALLTIASPLSPSHGRVIDQPTSVDVPTKGPEAESRTNYSYKAAFARAQKSNRPLVVIVTATWCAPCQVMKNHTIKKVMAKDGFEDVILAFVDVDQEPALAKNLTKGKGIPHVVVFEKEERKWKRRTLFGVQTVDTLQAFIKPRFDEKQASESVATQPAKNRRR